MSLKKVGGSGIWTEYKNEVTGESTLKEHKLKEVKRWCDETRHYWTLSSPSSRDLICRNCDAGGQLVVGKHTLIDGKIKNLAPDK